MGYCHYCVGWQGSDFPHFDGGRVVVGGKETLGAYECSFSAYMCAPPPPRPWALSLGPKFGYF